jgi:protein-S-isoprenylcysteine O-methyltransferase Ste14
MHFDYLILIISWGIYFLLHSGLASNSAKNTMESWLGGKKGYRLFYSLLSLVGLTLIGYLIVLFPSTEIMVRDGWYRYIGMVLSIWGVLIINFTFRSISLSSFLGLKKEENRELITHGIYAKIRHPLYTGTILITLGMFLFVPTDLILISVACIWVYLPIGIYFEEQKLIRQFGEDYLKYKKETKALFPGII